MKTLTIWQHWLDCVRGKTAKESFMELYGVDPFLITAPAAFRDDNKSIRSDWILTNGLTVREHTLCKCGKCFDCLNLPL